MTTVLSSLATPAGPANTSALSAQVLSCSEEVGRLYGWHGSKVRRRGDNLVMLDPRDHGHEDFVGRPPWQILP